MAAEAAGVPEVRAEPAAGDHEVAALRPPVRLPGAVAWPASARTLGSNQVRLPVAAGRDPVDVALRALTALAAER